MTEAVAAPKAGLLCCCATWMDGAASAAWVPWWLACKGQMVPSESGLEMKEGTNLITTLCVNRQARTQLHRTQATSSAGVFDISFAAQQLCEAELLLLSLLAVDLR